MDGIVVTNSQHRYDISVSQSHKLLYSLSVDMIYLQWVMMHSLLQYLGPLSSVNTATFVQSPFTHRLGSLGYTQ